jgi:hypothetical protein
MVVVATVSVAVTTAVTGRAKSSRTEIVAASRTVVAVQELKAQAADVER